MLYYSLTQMRNLFKFKWSFVKGNTYVFLFEQSYTMLKINHFIQI